MRIKPRTGRDGETVVWQDGTCAVHVYRSREEFERGAREENARRGEHKDDCSAR